MKTIRALTILSICLVGCDRSIPQQNSTPQQNPIAPNQSVDDYIAGWGEMGMMLPGAAQINIFRDNFDSAHGSLRNALSHSDDSVRMRAAYVISEIGGTAKPAGEDLLARLREESDELVRIYIVDALNVIGYNTDATIAVLSKRYEALDGANVAPNDDSSYAEVDEKIKIASALYSLTDADSKSEYYDFVVQWLDRPDDGLNGALLDGYWERRWIAVNSLAQMPTAADAIPKLESLQAEPNAKAWVNIHVPRVLGVLKKNAR